MRVHGHVYAVYAKYSEAPVAAYRASSVDCGIRFYCTRDALE